MDAKKKMRGLIAALIVTALTALAPLAIGADAWLNTNTVPIQSPQASTVTTSSAPAAGQVSPISNFAGGSVPVLRTGGS